MQNSDLKHDLSLNKVHRLFILFQVYTIDKLSNKLVVVGYATLNIFVETGSEKQPFTDSGGVQVRIIRASNHIFFKRINSFYVVMIKEQGI